MEYEQHGSDNLTGIWHGLYSYVSQPFMPESHFVCVLIDTGGQLTGTIHEVMNHRRKQATDEKAIVEGRHSNGQVDFLKIYDGSGKMSHRVHYAGQLNSSRDEIEGNWQIRSLFRTYSGRFLMIRKRGEEKHMEEGMEESQLIKVTEPSLG